MRSKNNIRDFIPLAEPYLGDYELELVTKCVNSGWISSAGAYVDEFEAKFARYCHADYAISTNSGTAALHLAMLGAHIGPGDEVLVPDLTFIATANAVHYTGATVVPVDVDPVTWCISPEEIQRAITPRTKAIVPVHLYGHPARMSAIFQLASSCGLKIIEDAAEAVGALYHKEPIGGLGHVGCFSFYGNKVITTGEGGMVVTNDPEMANYMRHLHDHGMSTSARYYHPYVGYNYRMTNIQAALGIAQLARLDEIVARRQAISMRYRQMLKDMPGLLLPPSSDWADPVCWLFSIAIDPDVYGITSREVGRKLYQDGIDSRPFFYPIHRQPAYYVTDGDFPVSDYLSTNGISLPTSPNMTLGEVDWIASRIRSYQHGR